MKKLLYITTKTCGPCRQFGPTMEKVAQSGIPVEKLDGEVNQAQVIKYGVRSVPTVIKVNAAGEELGRFTGIRSLQEVIDFYNN
jgi:thioredoxin-like negative regulator of GroEL